MLVADFLGDAINSCMRHAVVSGLVRRAAGIGYMHETTCPGGLHADSFPAELTGQGGSIRGLEESWRALLDAGINDWGGVSPLTRDYVNPEKPWPHVESLAAATAATGKVLLPR